MVGWVTVGGFERPVENISTGGMKGRMEYCNCNCKLVEVNRSEGNAPMSCGGSEVAIVSRERVVAWPNAEVESAHRDVCTIDNSPDPTNKRRRPRASSARRSQKATGRSA